MKFIAALLVCLTVKGTLAKTCQNPVTCPCGIKGENVTVCAPASAHTKICSILSKCEECQDGFNFCTKCPDGLKGPTCSLEIRKKRQDAQLLRTNLRTNQSLSDGLLFSAFMKKLGSPNEDDCPISPQVHGVMNCLLVPEKSCTIKCDEDYSFEGTEGQKEMTLTCSFGSWTPRTAFPRCIRTGTGTGVRRAEIKDCPDLAVPTFGTGRCDTVGRTKSCKMTCHDGYYFKGTEKEKVMTLTCNNGVFTPRTSFPDCIPTGECDYTQPEEGRSNCTADQSHTYCDVWCDHKYRGRFKCYPGRSWEPRLPPCLTPNTKFKQHGVYCRHPGRIPNSRMQYFAPGNSDPELYEIHWFPGGSVVEYTCEEGFRIREGSRRLRCETTGTWSEVLPTCVPVPKKITCRDPGFIENGVRRNTNGSESTVNQIYEEGQSVVYSCVSNEFALRGSPFLMCKQDGQWSRSLPECLRHTTGSERFCQDPGVDANGNRQSQSTPTPRGFTAGSQLEFSCKEGYRLNGEWSIICLASGKWTASRPTCAPNPNDELDYCENLGIISNGQVLYYPISGNRRLLVPQEEPEFPEGSRLEYSCDAGYTLLGEKTLICENPGFWSDDPPFCRRDMSRRRYCQYPGNVANGRVEYLNKQSNHPSSGEDEEYPVGSRLKYSCDHGYTPDGPATLTCKRSGSWSPALPPTCINANDNDRVTCPNLGSVLNARLWYFAPGVRSGQGMQLDIEMEEYPQGSTLEYVCEKGFWLQGSQSLVCGSTGFWSESRPTCVADCGRSYVQTTIRIRNGQETVSGAWPWVVSISLQGVNGASFVCGGAVFNSRAVVTAAHCLEMGRTYILRFGKHHFRVEDDDSQVLIRTSSRVIIHPDYSRRTFDSDIGLILFDPPIEYSNRVQPICMPTIDTTIRNIKPGTVGYVSGWGDTEKDRESDSLLFARLPVLSKQSCAESYMRQNLTVSMTENKFCAGYPNGTKSVCKGDSGSPFVFYDDLSQRYTLEGLVSFLVRKRTDAQLCGFPGRYAIFTRVVRFVHWLYESVQ